MIAREVASYRQDLAVDKPVQIAKGASISDRRRAVGFQVMNALGHSHAVISQAGRLVKPRGVVSTLTRRSLAVTALAGTAGRPLLDPVLDNCCLGAELKYVRSLEAHKHKRARPDYDADLVLHDTDGEPCAYQKSVGQPYAYVWRTSELRTRAGPRQVHAGSIIRPVYDLESAGQTPPHQRFADAGLVAVSGCVADDVVFMRFGLEVFPQSLRRMSLLDVTGPEAYDNYRQYVGEAVRLDSRAFETSVMGILTATTHCRVELDD